MAETHSLTLPKKLRYVAPSFQAGLADVVLNVYDDDDNLVAGSPYGPAVALSVAGVYETPTAVTVPSVGYYTLVWTSAVLGLPGKQVEEVFVSAIVPPGSEAPPSVSVCLITGHLLDIGGDPVANATVSFRLLGLPQTLGSLVALNDAVVVTTSDENGYFALSIVRAAVVEAIIPEVGYRREFTVPNQTSAVLFQIP